MYITLNRTEYIDKVWVFDNMVPVWISKDQFRFYEKPLPVGGVSSAIPFEPSKFRVNPNITALDFDIM